MLETAITVERQGFRQRVVDDLHHFARHERASVTPAFVLRMFLVTQGFQFVFARRLQDAMARIPVVGRPLRRIWWWWTCLVFGAEIAIGCEIGGGLYIPHPYGIVIGVCRVGRNVSILQNVTVGAKSEAEPGCATIGDGVFLSAGAALIGRIVIGNEATVGANAVVTKDVPPGATAIGIPARIIGR